MYACMHAEIMWDCSYTCMYVHCVYIRTNANLVNVTTRLTLLGLAFSRSCMDVRSAKVLPPVHVSCVIDVIYGCVLPGLCVSLL